MVGMVKHVVMMVIMKDRVIMERMGRMRRVVRVCSADGDGESAVV